MTELTRTLGYMTNLRLPESFCSVNKRAIDPLAVVAKFDMNVYGSSTHVIAGTAATLIVTTGLEAWIVGD